LEFLEDLNTFFAEREFAFNDDGDLRDQNINVGFSAAASVSFAVVQGFDQWAASTADFDGFFEGDCGGRGLDVQGQLFQVANVSPIADIQKLDCVLDLYVFFEEDLQ